MLDQLHRRQFLTVSAISLSITSFGCGKHKSQSSQSHMSVARADNVYALHWSEDAYVNDLPVYPHVELNPDFDADHLYDGDFRGELSEIGGTLSLPENAVEPPIIITDGPLLIMVREDVQQRFVDSFGELVHPIAVHFDQTRLKSPYHAFAIQSWLQAVPEDWTSIHPAIDVDQYRDLKTIVHPIFTLPVGPKPALFGIRHYLLPFFDASIWDKFVDATDPTWDLLGVSRILHYV